MRNGPKRKISIDGELENGMNRVSLLWGGRGGVAWRQGKKQRKMHVALMGRRGDKGSRQSDKKEESIGNGGVKEKNKSTSANTNELQCQQTF